jgi:thiol-disulfide isomerase/thioredoxin
MKKLFGFLLVAGMVSTAFVSKSKLETSSVVMKDGIDFQKSSYDEAIKEAKKSGKLIFIDAYTEWCGPCKKMAATSFMDPEVASLFNSKFINLKVEMEKSTDGPMIAQKYSVRAYPSLLFINGEGKVVKYAVGYQTAEQLIAIGKSL